MQSTLEEMQKTQSTLVDVMTKIQDHVIQDGDQDETTSVDEKPAISESTPSHDGPSGDDTWSSWIGWYVLLDL